MDEKSAGGERGMKGDLEMRMASDAVGGGSKGGRGAAGLLPRKGLRGPRADSKADAVTEARAKAAMGGEYEAAAVGREEAGGRRKEEGGGKGAEKEA